MASQVHGPTGSDQGSACRWAARCALVCRRCSSGSSFITHISSEAGTALPPDLTMCVNTCTHRCGSFTTFNCCSSQTFGMPDRSWRALPGGQPAATQAQKHQSHSRQVTSAGRSGSCCRRGCARRATPAGKSEPGAEVGLAGQKLVCRARGAGEVRLAEEGAAAARQHGA